MSKENPRFFIAYAHADKELYLQFEKLFIEQMPGNWSVWTDDNLPLGSNWAELIIRELANADYIIVLLSMAFSTSTFTKNKILSSFDRSKIIPILLKPYQYTRDSFFAETQVFLFARKNTNTISFEEWQGLINSSDDINSTFSNSFTKDLIAFIKDGNSELLIGEEMHNKTGILHLNNCGLTEWPTEVFQMNWLKFLNLGNYYNDFNKSSKSLMHSGAKSLKTKAQNNIHYIDPRIKELQNLEFLSLERNGITIIENLDFNYNLITLELGGNKINKIQGLDKLIRLKALFLYLNEIKQLEGLLTLSNLEFLDLGSNGIKKMEGLKKLTSIKEIYLYTNFIQRLEGVNELKNLSILELKKNYIYSIEKLIELPKLTYLSLDDNELEKIEGLDNLKSLQRLHLENNQIRRIEGLDNLTDLTLLHLENNQIEKIEGLDSLAKIKELDLQRNSIVKVEGLENLTSLTKLNLSENKIQSSNGILSLNVLKSLTKVSFKKNPFTYDTWLNQETLEAIGNNKEKFFAFLQDQHSQRLQEDYLPPLKIILLGNSEDGKTSLALKLIEGLDSSKTENSTHGLKIREWKIDHQRSALIYDFGGQDYYHASYNMFFTWNTGYVLVWDAARQAIQKINKTRNNEQLLTETQYRVYPVEYWLGNIDYWKRKRDLKGVNNSTTSYPSQIKLVSVQNLFKSEPVRTIPDSNRIDYQAAAYLGVDRVKGIQRTRQQLVKESIIDSFELLFKSPLPLTNEDIVIMQEILNVKEYKVLTVSQFNSKYPNASPYLLDILHIRGIVLNYTVVETIKNFVWLSPPATSDEIFKSLNLVALKQNGKVEPHLFACEDKLKALMIHSEILFEHFVLGKLTEYIIPSYLPYSFIDDALLTLATTDIKSGFSIRFKDYMPHGIMARLICRLGRYAGTNHFYRDLLIFSIYLPDTDISVKVWIKVDFGDLRLDVKSNVDDKSKEKLHEYLFHVILWAYWNLSHIEFDAFAVFTTPDINLEGNKSDSPNEEVIKETPFSNLVNFPFYLSLDGDYFLFYSDELNSESQSAPTHVRLFKWGDQVSKKEEYRASFNAFSIIKKPTPKKLFISYSSKDSAFMKRFAVHLESIKREGLISYWYDRLIESGTSWNEKIRKEMENSDLFIFLLSPDFLATSYIMDVELPKSKELSDRNNNIKLIFIQLRPCGWRRNSYLKTIQQLLKPDATFKELIMIETADNDEKWEMVIDLIEARVR